jgi:hypothetical protein
VIPRSLIIGNQNQFYLSLFMKALTVIIPAYNVAPYIGACIESVLHQTGNVQALQIIVVVDGATDNTLDETRRAARGHDDIVRIIVQHNAGLSAARNAGLICVETEYVTFLDGDDVWNEGYLETLLPILAPGTADLVEYDATRIDEFGRQIDLLKIAAAQSGATNYVSHEDFLSLFRCYTWARAYRTSLVRSYPFPTNRRFEDTATTPWYYWLSARSVSIGVPLISYRQRPQSILVAPRAQDINDIASTTAEAAAMYDNTGSQYWQRVAYRSFQQGCSRIVLQPFATWLPSIRVSRTAIANVPPPDGFARWLQRHVTPLYVASLYFKRLLQNGRLFALI